MAESFRYVNMTQVRLKFKDASIDSGEAAMKVLRKFALDIYRNATRKTPVDTGLLRNSWDIGVDVDPEGVGSPGGFSGLSPTSFSALANAEPGQTIIIINNVFYAPYIENGTDKIAPRAMLARSIMEAKATFGI